MGGFFQVLRQKDLKHLENPTRLLVVNEGGFMCKQLRFAYRLFEKTNIPQMVCPELWVSLMAMITMVHGRIRIKITNMGRFQLSYRSNIDIEVQAVKILDDLGL